MKIVLMDRDGTVIVDPPDECVDSEDKIEFFPDTIEALSYLAQNDFAIIFITNQAGIAEGRITDDDFNRIHDEVMKRLEPSDIDILRTYMCPHSPTKGCKCRKPKPDALFHAANSFNINLPNTYMVGDRLTDVLAGINAGTKTILVKTGNKRVDSAEATYTAQNLLDAAKYIVANS